MTPPPAAALAGAVELVAGGVELPAPALAAVELLPPDELELQAVDRATTASPTVANVASRIASARGTTEPHLLRQHVMATADDRMYRVGPSPR